MKCLSTDKPQEASATTKLKSTFEKKDCDAKFCAYKQEGGNTANWPQSAVWIKYESDADLPCSR